MTAHLLITASALIFKTKWGNNKTIGILTGCLYMAIVSCRQGAESKIINDEAVPKTNVDFDMKTFVNDWIAEMQKGHYYLEKTVNLDTESEIRQIENPDWKKEWSLFLETDLNSLILKDEFIKSVEKNRDDGHTEIYTAQKNTQLYRHIAIGFDPKNKPIAISIHKAQKSFLANMEEYLDINKQLNSYRIEKRESVIFSNEETILISGNILPFDL